MAKKLPNVLSLFYEERVQLPPIKITVQMFLLTESKVKLLKVYL